MSMRDQARLSALEADTKTLRAEVAKLRQIIDALLSTNEPEVRPAPPNHTSPRQMCPKCGIKPNYHLHVINCRGPWQGEGAQS